MTTRVSMTGAFLVPTNTAMNGASLIESEVSDYESIRDLPGGLSVPIMAGIVHTYPEAQTLLADKAVAYKSVSGWEIYLTEAGVKLTTDAVMSAGSVVQVAMESEPGLATLFESSGGGTEVTPAFWMGFKSTAEDGFGGGAGGWVPDDPAPHDGVFHVSVELVDQGDGMVGWENSETSGPRI